MDSTLLDRVRRFAPPWLRYMLTMSEAAKTGESWVVATGDDIGLWDTDAGAVLPMWPTQELAAETISDDKGEASPVSTSEVAERLLPFLTEADASISLFPNFCDDMLIEPSAVSEDLADFIANPVDIAAELIAEPVEREYDEWALLESPEVEEEEPAREWGQPSPSPEGTSRYQRVLEVAAATGVLWLLDDTAEDAVVGIVVDDRPSLAVFATQAEAKAYAADIDAELTARMVGADSLGRGWLLVAYGGHWSIALSPDAETAAFVEPSRFALDLAVAAGNDADEGAE